MSEFSSGAQDSSTRLREVGELRHRRFHLKGFKNAQMDDLAKALGVAKGIFYAYVESKEALVHFFARCADPKEVFAEVPRLPSLPVAFVF
jgi:tetracycline repressor-like protein